ncbi:MAG: hypothetical protein GX811_07900 [Lentisphaerae bacterium]|nr:hypothetical protein [Lentisphaerota bacterium]
MPMVEGYDCGAERRTQQAKGKGTPQGGVTSPLLSNIYLHWFEFITSNEAKRKGLDIGIVRYADDFVILAKELPTEFINFVEKTLQERMGLTVNREKTKQINIKEAGRSLDFLGYSFRYDRGIYFGRSNKYLNIFPSKHSLKRQREKLKKMTDKRQCFVPIPILIRKLNRQLKGWAQYFNYGYPSVAFRNINSYTRVRLIILLKRRSQREYRTSNGKSFYG